MVWRWTTRHAEQFTVHDYVWYSILPCFHCLKYTWLANYICCAKSVSPEIIREELPEVFDS